MSPKPNAPITEKSPLQRNGLNWSTNWFWESVSLFRALSSELLELVLVRKMRRAFRGKEVMFWSSAGLFSARWRAVAASSCQRGRERWGGRAHRGLALLLWAKLTARLKAVWVFQGSCSQATSIIPKESSEDLCGLWDLAYDALMWG